MKNIDINELKNTEVFKVPDNYFDTLTERVMSKIPADEANVISINQGKKHPMTWWRWSSVAACIAMVIVGTVFISKTYDSKPEEIAEITSSEEMSQEEMLEYSMLDADDVYCYLSGEEY